jgi:hypothetical protein
VPVTLVAAVAIGAVEAAVEIGYVALRDDLVAGMRVLLCLLLLLKLPILRAALHRSSAAAGVLLLYELTALLAATAPRLPGYGRGLLALSALAVLVLVGASLHAFPPPELRRDDS